MKKPLITILIVIFAIMTCLNSASAENETEILRNSESEEEVLAREDGHVNITFDNGYNGYCINYGEHEAKIGYEYKVEDTSYATNKNTGESVGNYLKVYFVDYYEDAMRDDIVTQHTIWHFTDDFSGWRIDPVLIENIKSTATNKTIPDSGAVRKINDTTEAVFDFQVLSSDKADHQNFFAYKITYRDIVNEIINSTNTATGENKTDNITDTNKSNTTSKTNDTQKKPGKNAQDAIAKNEVTRHVSDETPLKTNDKKENSNDDSKDINLKKHVTGKRTIGIFLLLIVLGIIAIKYTRRD
jgi:hypothetical protein